MCQIQEPLTAAKGLRLINDLIKNTPSQEKLIEWKNRTNSKQNDELKGEVGLKYWYLFCKRNAHHFSLKKGQSYDSDRDSWCTYSNFVNMYDMLEQKMVEAGVAIRLDSPT